jgi:catechol 2,3-dioxygenase-like lactoylglutathione lyase family enzyme
MLGYVTLGTSNLPAATEFYSALTAGMGWKKLMGTDRIVFFGSSMEQAALAICTPYDEQAPTAGNGTMVASTAEALKVSTHSTQRLLS